MWTRLNEEADEDWVRNCRSLKHAFSNKGASGNASILGFYLVKSNTHWSPIGLHNTNWLSVEPDGKALASYWMEHLS